MTFHDQLQRLGFETYNEYLASSRWASFRSRYAKSGQAMRCAVCGGVVIELHHRTYRNLGDEGLADVIPLCRKHHEMVHAILVLHHKFVEDTDWVIQQLRPLSPPKRSLSSKPSAEREAKRAKRIASRKARTERKQLEAKLLQTNLKPVTIQRTADDRPSHEQYLGAIAAGFRRRMFRGATANTKKGNG